MTGLETLQPVIFLLAGGVASVLVLPRLGISPIVGFILAGLALGHHGLDIIPHSDTIHLLAELGVVFLLFDIGLHFSLKNAWHERKNIFLLGPLQVFITAGIFYLIGDFYGLSSDINLVLAIALSLSSTAVVSQVLNDKDLQGSPNGNTAISILIFQDICAIFLLILANSVGQADSFLGFQVFDALIKCALSLGVAILIGRYLLRPIFKRLIRFENTEVFTMVALLLVLTTGAATGAIGLSLTLGAFLAGMIISETPFKHIIQTELRPFRFLLLGFFFVTIGMMIDIHVLIHELPLVLGILLVAVSIKATVIFGLFVLMRRKVTNALQQAALLFQGSEFLFVVIAAPAISNALDDTLVSALIVSVALSMAITSFIFSMTLKYLASRFLDSEAKEQSDLSKESNHPSVIILGMTQAGYTVARALNRFEIPYVCIESKYDNFHKARLKGFPVIYGEQADIRFWENLGIQKFKFLSISCPTLKLAEMYEPIVRERYPHLVRYTIVNNKDDGASFERLGLIPVCSLGVPPGLELAVRILEDHDIAGEDIQDWMRKIQSEHLDSVSDIIEHQSDEQSFAKAA